TVRVMLGDQSCLADHAEELRRFRPDVVLDMILMTEKEALSLVASLRGVAGRLVAVSSGDVYRAYGVFCGLEPGPPEPAPLREDAPLRQVLYPYRANAKPGDQEFDYEKILVERTVMVEPELPATVVRLPIVYGPGDPQRRLAPYLKRMLEGRPVILLDEGVARWRCPRGFVEDVSEAIALTVTSPAAAGRTYNVAEPTGYTE